MLDSIIVFAYLATLLIIGIMTKNSSSHNKSFLQITNTIKNNKLILVATIFASASGGGTTFGISEKAFAASIAHSYGLILAIPIDLLIAVYVVPKMLAHSKAETIGDIMYSYYGNAGRYIGGISAVLVSIGFLTVQISVSGRIFKYILQIDYLYGILISYGIVVIYTTLGGIQSVIFTNVLQFFAMIIAIPIIAVFGIYQLGISNFIQSVPLDKVSFAHNPHLMHETISATLAFMVINLLPTFVQRTLLSQNVVKTQSAIYIKSVIYFFFLIIVTINGLIAYIKYPDISSSIALPYLIDQIIPSGILGIVVVGLLASVMSTADSDLNIASITLMKDLVNPIVKVYNRPALILPLVRSINVLLGVFVILIALYFTQIVDIVVFVAGSWGPVVLVPLLFGLFGITISNKGFICACLLGALSFILWSFLVETRYGLRAIFVGTMINLLAFLLFYLSKTLNQKTQKS